MPQELPHTKDDKHDEMLLKLLKLHNSAKSYLRHSGQVTATEHLHVRVQHQNSIAIMPQR